MRFRPGAGERSPRPGLSFSSRVNFARLDAFPAAPGCSRRGSRRFFRGLPRLSARPCVSFLGQAFLSALGRFFSRPGNFSEVASEKICQLVNISRRFPKTSVKYPIFPAAGPETGCQPSIFSRGPRFPAGRLRKLPGERRIARGRAVLDASSGERRRPRDRFSDRARVAFGPAALKLALAARSAAAGWISSHASREGRPASSPADRSAGVFAGSACAFGEAWASS